MWKWLLLLALVITTAFTTIVFNGSDKLVCYHKSWANYRLGNCRYTVENIDTSLCTHIIYAFVGINVNGSVRIMDSWLDDDRPDNLGGLRRFTTNARINCKKSLVGIGGESEGSSGFTKVVSSPALRDTFISNVIAFLKKYGFDGFDFNWQYPGQKGGADTDKTNFSKLLIEMRAEFNKYGYLLTGTVAACETSAALSYEIPELSKNLDFINIMTFDMHGAWDSVTGHNAPLYSRANETAADKELNVDACIKYWIGKGADPKKVILGVATYGRTFNVPGSDKGIGAPASGGASAGQCTGETGILGYNEICQKLAAGGWTIIWNDEQKVPYAYNGNQWIGYDNEKSIVMKAQYARDNELGGVMVWSVETDDFTGACGKKNVLLNTIRTTLHLDLGCDGTTTTTTTPPPPPPSCGSSATCTANGYLRDANDCAVFYQCVLSDGCYSLYRFVCASGLYFDERNSVCNYTSLVQCYDAKPYIVKVIPHTP